MKRLSADGMSSEVTPADRLWLLRAVQAEGEPRQAVAEALVNLHALRRAGGANVTLTQTVRAYAQPVNPRWYPTGDLFLQSLSSALPRDRPAMVVQANKRERLLSVRTVFDPQTIRAVDAALSGVHRTDVTDYAAPSIDATKKGYTARSEPEPGKNRLWTRKPGFGGYSVTNAARNALPVIALLALALAVWKG